MIPTRNNRKKLKEYIDLRELNEALGLTGENFPRAHGLPREFSCIDLSPKDLRIALKEEKSLRALYGKYDAFNEWACEQEGNPVYSSRMVSVREVAESLSYVGEEQ